jgi:hypothetical protein
MDKRLTIVAFLVNVVLIASVFGAETSRRLLLRDGFGLAAVDGELVLQDSNTAPELWFFRLACDVNDGRGRVAAGTTLELLPSSTLEKMAIDAERRAGKNYRLWGRVTKYKGRNFIFPAYFLPLAKTSKPEVTPLQEPEGGTEEAQPVVPPNSVPAKGTEEKSDSGDSGKTGQGPAFYDSNDALPIPKEMIEKLKSKPVRPTKRADSGAVKVVMAKPPKHAAIRRDSVLADRMGFLCVRDEGLPVFGFDALGRNIQNRSLRLLPCYALERTERKQADELEPLRFKIAGIVTRYKGREYLLLERAVRVYSHGSFGR